MSGRPSSAPLPVLWQRVDQSATLAGWQMTMTLFGHWPSSMPMIVGTRGTITTRWPAFDGDPVANAIGSSKADRDTGEDVRQGALQGQAGDDGDGA